MVVCRIKNSMLLNGTSLQGYTKPISAEEIDSILGSSDPSYDEVRFEWNIRFDDGIVASIYCYKIYIGYRQKYKYHIGCHRENSEIVLSRVKRLLNGKIKVVSQ